MEKLKTLLIANRGEIATRIIKTAKYSSKRAPFSVELGTDARSLVCRKLNIRTIAIYIEADAASSHVIEADVSVLLSGGNAKGYLDRWATSI